MSPQQSQVCLIINAIKNTNQILDDETLKILPTFNKLILNI